MIETQPKEARLTVKETASNTNGQHADRTSYRSRSILASILAVTGMAVIAKTAGADGLTTASLASYAGLIASWAGSKD